MAATAKKSAGHVRRTSRRARLVHDLSGGTDLNCIGAGRGGSEADDMKAMLKSLPRKSIRHSATRRKGVAKGARMIHRSLTKPSPPKTRENSHVKERNLL